ncbi:MULTISPECIES: hypothetical protein [unclassified Sutcliffiella]|uniref:hypothetical protein n=1 Tax=unclassified Sutcliffiella TaxID=2837532 RepID=UPI0030D1473A
MSNEVSHADLKVKFKSGFTLSPELSLEEALNEVLKAVKSGEAKEVNIAVEYYDDGSGDLMEGE